MCNYDIIPLSTAVMLLLGLQGVSDLIIVVVKLQAYEDMVTYLRIKPVERDKEIKGEGSDMLTKGVQMYRLLSLPC